MPVNMRKAQSISQRSMRALGRTIVSRYFSPCMGSFRAKPRKTRFKFGFYFLRPLFTPPLCHQPVIPVRFDWSSPSHPGSMGQIQIRGCFHG
jgi:hypothetical protein